MSASSKDERSPRAQVRDALVRTGFVERTGEDRLFATLEDADEAFGRAAG